MKQMVPVSSMFDMPDEDAEVIMSRIVELVHKHKTMPDVVKELTAKYGKKPILAGMMLTKTFEKNEASYEREDEPGTGDESVCEESG